MASALARRAHLYGRNLFSTGAAAWGSGIPVLNKHQLRRERTPGPLRMVGMIQHILAEIALAAIGARVGVVALHVAILAAGDILRRALFDIVGPAECVVVIAIGVRHGRLSPFEAAAQHRRKQRQRDEMCRNI